MNKILIILILVLLAVGFVVWQKKQVKGQMTNQQMLETDTDTPIDTQSDVEYFTGAKGYFVRPAKEGNYPGVVMIHENRGLRPEIRATAEQLAKEGYMVLAVDLFNNKVVETQDEAKQLTTGFDQQKGIDNMKAAAAFLKEKGATKVASLGWCFGGGQSLQLALSGQPLDATVIYYGSKLVTDPNELSRIKWPVLGIFGQDDQVVSVDSVNQFRDALNKDGITNEIYVYPGVGHAFANPSGMNFAPRETQDAWQKTLSFLGKYLK